MEYRQFPFLSIEVDEELSVIIMNWNGSFTSALFREAVTYCMDVVAAKGLKNWLANSILIDKIQPEDQKWTSEVLLAGLSAMGVKKVALVIPEDLYSHLAISTIMVEGKKHITYDTHYFIKKEEALAWIQS